MRIVLLVILLFCSAAYAQMPFHRHVWLNASNTPVAINDILQDEDGYIWIGTDNGLYKYNGRSVQAVPDSIHLPVTALATCKGIIYTGHADGTLGTVKENVLSVYNTRLDKPVSKITSLRAAAPDLLWISTEEEGILLMSKGNILAFDKEDGLSDNFAYNITYLRSNEIMVGTDRGINVITALNGKIKSRIYTTSNGLPDNIVRAVGKVNHKSWYWLGTQQGGLALFCNQSKRIWVPEVTGGWQWGQINDILTVADNKLWVITEPGYLLKVSFIDSMHIDVRPYFFDRRLQKIKKDKAGNLWCATDEGLTMVTAEYVNYLPVLNEYSLKQITAIACDRKDQLWYALGNKLYSIPLNNIASDNHYVLTAEANITSLYADAYNNIWIGTFGKGLWRRRDDGRLTKVTDIPYLENESVLDITGVENRIWVAGLNGVQELQQNGGNVQLIKHHDKHSGIGSDYVYQIYPDRHGNIWMATDGAGVCMYDGQNYKQWNAQTGLKSNVVYTLTEDAQGNIWAGSYNNGLFKYNGSKWEQFSTDRGLQDINISAVAANGSGQVVVVHARGIDLWFPGSRQFRHYNSRMGADIDSTSNVLKLSANDMAGNVYVPFEHGFVQFNNIEVRYDITPGVAITGLTVLYNPQPLGTHEFSHAQNYLGFSYNGINYTNPERLHYRYKLEGYNNNWVVTGDEYVPFPQLPAGSYTFRVQASLSSSFAGASEAQYSFTIAKPFWARTWFIAVAALALLGLGYLYIRLRERNLRKLSSLQKERMMFEYEHLKSQVNPHFLFNSLNTLSSLIEENQELATDYTEHLADLYRNMLAYRDKDLILLREELSILQNYMYIQQSRFGKALQLQVEVAEELNHNKRVVPLALQLLVENAIKHNIVSLSMPLTITIIADDHTIIISNPIQPKISKEKGAGLGIVNIKKRYALLTKRSVTFENANGTYIVTLPLL